MILYGDNDNEFHFRSVRVHSALRLLWLIAAWFFFLHSITANEKGEMKGRPPLPLLPSAFYPSPSPPIPTGIQGEKISSEIKFRLI